jgi:hypothetical protein
VAVRGVVDGDPAIELSLLLASATVPIAAALVLAMAERAVLVGAVFPAGLDDPVLAGLVVLAGAGLRAVPPALLAGVVMDLRSVAGVDAGLDAVPGEREVDVVPAPASDARFGGPLVRVFFESSVELVDACDLCPELIVVPDATPPAGLRTAELAAGGRVGGLVRPEPGAARAVVGCWILGTDEDADEVAGGRFTPARGRFGGTTSFFVGGESLTSSWVSLTGSGSTSGS